MPTDLIQMAVYAFIVIAIVVFVAPQIVSQFLGTSQCTSNLAGCNTQLSACKAGAKICQEQLNQCTNIDLPACRNESAYWKGMFDRVNTTLLDCNNKLNDTNTSLGMCNNELSNTRALLIVVLVVGLALGFIIAKSGSAIEGIISAVLGH